MQSRREQLAPGVRAKTILAACDQIAMRVLDDEPGQPGPGSWLGVYLDRSGEAFLVVHPGTPAPKGTVRISCRASLSGLGVLRLDGCGGQRLRPQDHPAVQHALCAHSPHGHTLWEPGAQSYDPTNVELVRIDVGAVHVLTPATAADRAQCIRVDLTEYDAASADSWALDLEPHRSRLEHDHQEQLRLLAATRLEHAAGLPWTVLVRSIGPTHLELACLTDDGVDSLRLEYDEPMSSPRHLARWVVATATRRT